MKRKKPIRKDTPKKAKVRIQNLLKLIVRAVYKTCIFAGGEYGKCAGVLSADHVVSRARSATYGLSKNVVGVCERHHIWWKPYNLGYWADRVKYVIGQAVWDELHELARKPTNYQLKDWQRVEENLKGELKNLQ